MFLLTNLNIYANYPKKGQASIADNIDSVRQILDSPLHNMGYVYS